MQLVMVLVNHLVRRWYRLLRRRRRRHSTATVLIQLPGHHRALPRGAATYVQAPYRRVKMQNIFATLARLVEVMVDDDASDAGRRGVATAAGSATWGSSTLWVC